MPPSGRPRKSRTDPRVREEGTQSASGAWSGGGCPPSALGAGPESQKPPPCGAASPRAVSPTTQAGFYKTKHDNDLGCTFQERCANRNTSGSRDGGGHTVLSGLTRLSGKCRAGPRRARVGTRTPGVWRASLLTRHCGRSAQGPTRGETHEVPRHRTSSQPHKTGVPSGPHRESGRAGTTGPESRDHSASAGPDPTVWLWGFCQFRGFLQLCPMNH